MLQSLCLRNRVKKLRKIDFWQNFLPTPFLKDNSQIIITVTSAHMSIQEVLLRFTESTINPVFNTPWLLTGRGYQQSHSSLELQIAWVSQQSNYTPQSINPKATTIVTEQITGVSLYILTPQLLSRGEGGELLKGGLQKIPCLLVPILNYRQSPHCNWSSKVSQMRGQNGS